MKVKESRKEQLQELYSVVEQAADSIFITNREGVIEYVNPAFEKITGYTKKEALGHTPRIIKSGLKDIKYYKKLWSTILSGKTFRTVIVNKRKDGKLFYADHTITPIKDSKGKVTRFVGIWKDITPQIELDKRKDEFIAMAAHELKNPLTTIKGYTELLAARLSQDKKSLDFLSQLNSQTDKIINLINDFFNAGQIQSGRLVLRKTRLDFDKLAEKIINDFQYSCKTHKVLLEGKTNKNIFADPERIGQVVINFLANAVKYSPPESKIRVILSFSKTHVTLGVKDQGIGIHDSEKKKVFQRFYKVNQKERVGFGLGLYICSEIIKAHKGKIWVEAEEGKGATFYFSLRVSR